MGIVALVDKFMPKWHLYRDPLNRLPVGSGPRTALATIIGIHKAKTRSRSGFTGNALRAITSAAVPLQLPQQRRPFTPDLDEAALAVHLEAKVDRLLLGFA